MAKRTINCDRCGRQVDTWQANTKYCPECRAQREKEHGSRHRPDKLVGPRSLACQECGATFDAKRIDAKCCPECKMRKERAWGKRARPERNTGRRAEAYCAVCQRPFVAKRKDARLCPDHRRRRLERLQIEEFVPEGSAQVYATTLNCTICGAVFIARRSDALYCPACYIAKRREIALKVLEKQRDSVCPECGGRKHASSPRCIRCAAKDRMGEKNIFWRGGKSHSCGYVSVRTKGSGKRYTLEHKVVWEAVNGPLPKGWIIHHLNGIKADNRMENLAGMPRQEHHSRPRKALEPYEARIRTLEERIRQLETKLASHQLAPD